MRYSYTVPVSLGLELTTRVFTSAVIAGSPGLMNVTSPIRSKSVTSCKSG